METALKSEDVTIFRLKNGSEVVITKSKYSQFMYETHNIAELIMAGINMQELGFIAKFQDFQKCSNCGLHSSSLIGWQGTEEEIQNLAVKVKKIG